MGLISGILGLCMRGNGMLIRLKEKGYFGIVEVKFILGSSIRIGFMDMEFTYIRMVLSMKVSGLMIFRMDMEKKIGLMVPNILVRTRKV